MEIGEFRIETDEQTKEVKECLMLMRDTENRRVSLKVNFVKQQMMQQGVITEKSGRSNVFQLESMISESLQCVPRNYKVGESTRSGFFREEQTTINKVNIDL